MVGMEKFRPGGALNFNPYAARLTCVTVSLAWTEMEGRRLPKDRSRSARAALWAVAADLRPRSDAIARLTASAMLTWSGPAGTWADGIPPARFPGTSTST